METVYEKNIDHFEIEVAKGTADFQNGMFVKIGEVMSPGASNSERCWPPSPPSRSRRDAAHPRRRHAAWRERSSSHPPALLPMPERSTPGPPRTESSCTER